MAVWFDGDGNCRSEPVTIRDASPDGILFVTQEEFPIDQTVWIETGDHEEMMFAVKHCEQRGRRYWAGAQRVTHERRRDDRSPVLGGANLHWEHADGGRCQTLALVRNASDSGMQLESSVPLPVGTEVELSGARLRCAGSVRYCRESGHKFLIGLKITEKTIVPG
jgi:hypothetical protein